jgi:hypothetical protein
MAKFTLSLNGPLLNPPKSVMGASFDYSGRYRLIGEIIARYFKDQKGRPKNILDVGGLGSFLGDLVGTPVTIYDSEVEGESEGQQKGDGANMVGITDGSFDAVVTSDTLEHIPRPDRKSFVDELVRASNDLIILCAPFGDHGAAREEARLLKTYEDFAGHEHRWLAEHHQFGLPLEKEILSYFKVHKLSVVVLNHSSLTLWRTLMGINLFANDIPDVHLHAQLKKLNQYYNENLLFQDFATDSYRTFIVASKQKELVYKPPQPTLTPEQNQAVLDLVDNFYSALMKVASHIPATRAELNDNIQTRQALEGQIAELSTHYNNVVNSKTWRYSAAARQLYKASPFKASKSRAKRKGQ